MVSFALRLVLLATESGKEPTTLKSQFMQKPSKRISIDVIQVVGNYCVIWRSTWSTWVRLFPVMATRVSSDRAPRGFCWYATVEAKLLDWSDLFNNYAQAQQEPIHKHVSKAFFISSCDPLSREWMYYVNGWFRLYKSLVQCDCSRQVNQRNATGDRLLGSQEIRDSA
jgi:hypothetical protein